MFSWSLDRLGIAFASLSPAEAPASPRPIWKAGGRSSRPRALSERVASAVEVVNRLVVNEQGGVVRSLTADKGYFAIEEIAQIQEFDMCTVIGDAHTAGRRKEALAAPLRKALHRAACAVKSQSGQALLRQRDMHPELNLKKSERLAPSVRTGRTALLLLSGSTFFSPVSVRFSGVQLVDKTVEFFICIRKHF